MCIRVAACVALVALASALSTCAALPEASYKLYPGPVRPPVELAVVRLGDAGVAEFDGRLAARSDWSEVMLLAGEHTIRWQQEFGVSVLVDLRGAVAGGFETRVALNAGHVYTLHADRTTGPGYRMYFWIVDETDGRIVSGQPKP